MKLIGNRRSDLVATPSDPRCVAIIEKHGDLLKFNTRWSPANLWKIAENVDRSVEAEIPSLIMLMKSYGKEAIMDNLNMHLLAVVNIMGINKEDFTVQDIRMIAQLITECEAVRTLNYAFLLTFFAKLAQGEYQIYGGKPYQFMAALQQYAKDAKARQAQLQDKAEKERKKRSEQEAAKEAITFEEYAKAHGITEKSLLEYLQNKG